MFIIFIVILFICSPTLSSPESHIKYGGHALNALQHLLNFFESDANNVNLDGLYGLRIAQGQLNALHQSLTSSENKQLHLTDKNNIIQSLAIQIESIATLSLNNIARDASTYLHRFSLIASRPFTIEYKSRKIHQHFIDKNERNSHFDEEESDKCFAELLGKSKRRFHSMWIFLFFQVRVIV
jgi:hypothetical protein